MEIEKLIWTEDLSMKNGVIDAQHKQLIDHINDIIELIKTKNAKSRIRDLMDFLESYMLHHLQYEEEYMEKNNFDEIRLKRHKIHHGTLKIIIRDLSEKFLLNGASDELAVEIKTKLGDWFLNHIDKIDREYAEYIRSHPW